MASAQFSSPPFGELAIPSIEVGFDNNEDAFWAKPKEETYSPSWNDFLAEPSVTPYSISPCGSPPAQSPEHSTAATTTTSRRKTSKSSSSKSPTRAASSSNESEEERRKSRKREQNRESQRNFRRRQENRVKFLESKTLELEANSRQLRAENERLKSELQHAQLRNDELQFSVMNMNSLPTTPLQYTLDSPSMMPYDLNEDQFFAPPSAVPQEPAYATVW